MIHDKEGLDEAWERIYMSWLPDIFHPRVLLKSSSEVEHFMRNAPEYALD